MSPLDRLITDPMFASTLREIHTQRGLSLRSLEKFAYLSKSVLGDLETGKRKPTAAEARRLDDVLQADDQLAQLVTEVGSQIDEERLLYAARNPRRVDVGTVIDLATLLAAQRHLDDTMGSAAVLAPAQAQLDIVTTLVGESVDAMRPMILDIGAQWAQFVGWLNAATGDVQQSAHAFSLALDWATERGDIDMIATALSFKGYLAEGIGHIGSMIGLSAAAQRDQNVYAAQRAYSAGQEARGRAITGDEQGAITKISEAAEIGALQDPQSMPPWSYYYTPDFMQIQRGLIYYLLGEMSEHRNAEAIDLLRAGLDGLSPDARRAEWAGVYLCQLAEVHARAAELPEATTLVQEALIVAGQARSSKVRRRAMQLARRYKLAVERP